MVPYAIGFILIVVSTALQSAWPPWLRIAGQPPHLALAAVVSIGLVRGAVDGCLAGLIAALVYAGTMHVPLGGLALSFMVVGTFAGLLRGSLLSERLEVAVLVTAAAVLLARILCMIFVPPPVFLSWLKTTFWSLVYTAAAAPLMFWLAQFTRSREGA